jgi:hypothetical protein
MEESITKTKLKMIMCNHRRLNIQHEINENLRKKNHLSNLNSYQYQKQLFHRKLNQLRKSLEHIEPYTTEDTNEEDSLIAPNCFKRIQNHFHLLNFSSYTKQRLLCQAPSYNKSSEHISHQLPNITQKINPYIKGASFYQSRPAETYSCRSAINDHIFRGHFLEQETFQSYLNQQISNEQKKQFKNNQRKNSLLKELDELKHTIDDPNSTFSVLAALSRAILFLNSGRE